MLIYSLFYILNVFSVSSSSLDYSCAQSTFACGECESVLQKKINKYLFSIISTNSIRIDDSLHWQQQMKQVVGENQKIKITKNVIPNEVIKNVIDILKESNVIGDNKLNYIFIAESESLQKATIKNKQVYPRVILKSINSEFLFTFNTDPEAPGYMAFEMIRWNGREGKFEFQELSFENSNKIFDISGTKCLECHKSPDPRPNWDTYRAWAGVVPSRDDMLETTAKEKNPLLTLADGEIFLQPDSIMYLNIIRKIARDKTNKEENSRFALLDLNFDFEDQLKDLVEDIDYKKLSELQKVNLIIEQLSQKSFYRIRHYPDIRTAQSFQASNSTTAFNVNFDTKTAPKAGPSQFMFDQLLAQNICKINESIKSHDNFDKLKYLMAGISIKCMYNSNLLKDYLPVELQNKIISYYLNTSLVDLNEMSYQEKKDFLQNSEIDIKNLFEIILIDTQRSHARSDIYKTKRHYRLLKKYYNEFEPQNQKADQLSKYYSENVITPERYPFHAIEDPGGVKGVLNSETSEISVLRLLLIPFGINVQHWSLVRGKDNIDNTYSFSDQFVLFLKSKMIDAILSTLPTDGLSNRCEMIKLKTGELWNIPNTSSEQISSFNTEEKGADEIDFGEIELNIMHYQELCSRQKSLGESEQNILDLETQYLSLARPEYNVLLKKCAQCHNEENSYTMAPTFIGIDEFLSGKEDSTLHQYLNTHNPSTGIFQYELFAHRLGIFPEMKYGVIMPPSMYADNDKYIKQNQGQKLSAQELKKMKLQVQKIRSEFMADYTTRFANKVFIGGQEKSLQEICIKLGY